MIRLENLEQIIVDFNESVYDTIRDKNLFFLYDFARRQNFSFYVNNKITIEGLLKPYLKFIQNNVSQHEYSSITITFGTYKNITPALYFTYEDKYTYLVRKLGLSYKNLVILEDMLNKYPNKNYFTDEQSPVDDKNIPLDAQTENMYLPDEEDGMPE